MLGFIRSHRDDSLFLVANPNIAATLFSICFTLVTPDTIINNGSSLNVDTYLAHEKRHYEDIDVKAVSSRRC